MPNVEPTVYNFVRSVLGTMTGDIKELVQRLSNHPMNANGTQFSWIYFPLELVMAQVAIQHPELSRTQTKSKSILLLGALSWFEMYVRRVDTLADEETITTDAWESFSKLMLPQNRFCLARQVSSDIPHQMVGQLVFLSSGNNRTYFNAIELYANRTPSLSNNDNSDLYQIHRSMMISDVSYSDALLVLQKELKLSVTKGQDAAIVDATRHFTNITKIIELQRTIRTTSAFTKNARTEAPSFNCMDSKGMLDVSSQQNFYHDDFGTRSCPA